MARSKSVTRKSSSKGKLPSLLPYRNPKLSAEKRVRDLLTRMTLEEKAAQMICVWQQKAQTLLDADGQFRSGEGQSRVQEGTRAWAGGPPQRCRPR